jgi:hypothetical protein
MNKPHKYAEAIKAWADGKEIQCRFIGGQWPWETYVREGMPSFDHSEIEWRVKPMTEVRWVNLYDGIGAEAFASKEAADDYADARRIACVRVEFTEGEGLEDTQGGESGL